MTESHPLATPGQVQQPVVVDRTYRATAVDLWALWTTKNGFESWWGPQSFRADVHEIDAREGGVISYDMVAATAEMIAAMAALGRPPSHPAHARFTIFLPHAQLTLTSTIDFLPGVDPYENAIEVTFEPMGEYVRMVVTLAPMHDAEFTKMSIEGFTSQLSKLDARFALAPMPWPAAPTS